MNPPVVNPVSGKAPAVASERGSFWSRHKTVINFWLDATLLILFLIQAWLLTVIAVVFPRGSLDSTIWGANLWDWLDVLFTTTCVFAVGIVVHVMLHWPWICGTFTTRLMRRKMEKDDGSQTLVGVGLLIALLHVLGAAVLAAKIGLVHP